jgi:hypothetical protein
MADKTFCYQKATQTKPINPPTMMRPRFENERGTPEWFDVVWLSIMADTRDPYVIVSANGGQNRHRTMTMINDPEHLRALRDACNTALRAAARKARQDAEKRAAQ